METRWTKGDEKPKRLLNFRSHGRIFGARKKLKKKRNNFSKRRSRSTGRYRYVTCAWYRNANARISSQFIVQVFIRTSIYIYLRSSRTKTERFNLVIFMSLQMSHSLRDNLRLGITSIMCARVCRPEDDAVQERVFFFLFLANFKIILIGKYLFTLDRVYEKILAARSLTAWQAGF